MNIENDFYLCFNLIGKYNVMEKISKILFLLSGVVMFSLIGASVLVYQNEIRLYFSGKQGSEEEVKVQVLQSVQSEGSDVEGVDFFSEEELKEMARDTATVKIKVQEK